MKKYFREFALRGAIGIGIGNIICMLAAQFQSLASGTTEMTVYTYAFYTASATAIGIVFGGLSVLYNVERLSLLAASAIHFCAMFATFYVCALLAKWISFDRNILLVSLAVFIGCYAVIWLIIYAINRANAKKMNAALGNKKSG